MIIVEFSRGEFLQICISCVGRGRDSGGLEAWAPTQAGLDLGWT